jgi:uncharacterized membrane protein
MSWGILFRLRQYIKGSLWLVPFVGGLIGLALAEVGAQLEARGATPAVWHYTPETATAVLSATIGAVASLTGFVVTVTVLGVQMATGTFSPRYMRLWYRDAMLKYLLAVLIGTLIFSFSVIRRVEADSVPDFGVTLASGGVAVSLLLFVLYLDRFIHRMRPVAVAALMAAEGRRAFEDALAEASRPDTTFVPKGSEGLTTAPTFVVRARRAGTIQAVDARGLTRFARRHQCLLVFRHTVGDFVPVGAAILEVHGADLSPGVTRRLSGLVALGVERTIEQDPVFAIRVMVDVATRALSPAVNDPTTAVQVLDHLGETLRMMGTAQAPPDQQPTERLLSGVVMPIRTWPEILSLAVTEIREYGATSIQVVRRLRALLQELGDLVVPERRPAVEEELRRLDETVAAAFAGSVDLDRARASDAQGIGGPWQASVPGAWEPSAPAMVEQP